MLRYNSQRQTAARSEAAFDPHVPGMAGANQIVEDAVDDRFIERVDVSIGRQIKFERLRFKAARIGNVFDKNLGKIRLAGHRAKRREIRAVNADGKIALSIWIGKRFKRGLLGRLGKGGLGVSQQRQRGVFLVFFLVLHSE